MQDTIDFKKFLQDLRKKIPLILLFGLLFAILSGVISYTLLKPVYQASTQFLINQNNITQEFNTQNIEANIQLISTYSDIIKSPIILDEVIEDLALKETTSSLNERISVSSLNGSQVVTLNVEDSSIEQAVLIANTTVSVFQDEIKELMKVDNVNILTPAIIPINPEPIKPNPILNMIIGAVIGLFLGTSLAILLNKFNTTIRIEEDIEEITGLQSLGIVCVMPALKKKNVKHKKELRANVGNEKIKAANSPKIDGSY